MDTHFKIDYAKKLIMFTGLIWKCALKSREEETFYWKKTKNKKREECGRNGKTMENSVWKHEII